MAGPTPTQQPMAASQGAMQGSHEPANLGDILERVLDRGLVIAGDIRVSLLDIELLTIKLRLVIASLDTAREIGIDWWERDPWLSSKAARELEAGNGRREVTAQESRAEAASGPRGDEQVEREEREERAETRVRSRSGREERRD